MWNVDPNKPWIYFQTNNIVERETFFKLIPCFHQITDFNLYTRSAKYNNKKITWNPVYQWRYHNNRTVHFNKTPTEGTNSELSSDESSSESNLDKDTAQVEELLKQAKTTVTLAIQVLSSHPGTPGLLWTESATSCNQRIPSSSPPKPTPKLKYSHMVESTLQPHDPGKPSYDLSHVQSCDISTP